MIYVKIKLGQIWGRLPNPNFKVFFTAISRIKQARRLDINLNGINIEKKLELT